MILVFGSIAFQSCIEEIEPDVSTQREYSEFVIEENSTTNDSWEDDSETLQEEFSDYSDD